jgi:hypothetical protein
MPHLIRDRLMLLVALASLAGLIVATSPARATDDPAPGLSPADGIAPGSSLFTGADGPSSTRRSRRVRVRLRYRGRGACRGVRVSVAGPGATGLRRVDVRSRGHRIGRDRKRPFRLTLRGKRLRGSKKIQIRLVDSRGNVRTIKRRLRSCSSTRRASARRSAFEPLPVALALDELLGSSFTSAT